MNCPNINIKEVRNEFNSVIEAFGGRPMTIEEFKSRDLRNQRTGRDNKAMQLAYYVWDKTNGDGLAALPAYINSNISNESARIRAIVNEMIGARPSSKGMTRSVKSEILRINSILQSRVRDDYFGYSTIDDSSLDFNGRMVYDPRSGQVMLQINLANANIGSVFHEYSHPILLSIRNSNSDRFFEIFEDLRSSEEFSELRNKAINRIKSIYGNDFLLSEDLLDGGLEEEIIATATGIYFKERNERTFSQKFKDFIVKLYKLFLDFFGIKSETSRNISADEIKSFSDLLEFLGDSNTEIPIPKKDAVEAYKPEPDQLVDEYVTDFVDNDIKQLAPIEGVSDLIGTQLAHKVPLLPQKPKNDIITEGDAKLKIAIDITSKLKNLLDEEINLRHGYISSMSRLVVDIKEKGWYNKLLDNFFGDNETVKKTLKSPLGPYIPKFAVKSIYPDDKIHGKLLSLDSQNNANSILDTGIGGDMASNIEVTSKLLKHLESNPNGSTDYDFDFSKISGISEIELEVVNEFMSEFIEKSKAWAIENNKPEPTKVKNSRLAKRLSEHLNENYRFRLLPVEEQEFTYGIRDAVSRDYFKSDVGGSEILISNGLIVNSGHTYRLRSGEREVNALGWFIEFSVNDKYLLYEFQSDFADGDWDIRIPKEAGLSFDYIVSGLLNGKHIDNTDNFDGKFKEEYLKYVDKSAKFLLSVVKDYSNGANGRFDSILNMLSLQRKSIHNLIGSLDFANKLIELKNRELGKVRKYGMNLKRYSKKQLNLISSIAERHINSIGAKTGKRTGRRTISGSDAAFNARKEIVSIFYDNHEFNNIGISVSLADFKNRVDRAIAIHDSAELNFGSMSFAGKNLPVEEAKKIVQYRISRWESIHGGEGVSYRLVRDGSRNTKMTYKDGSKKISVDIDMADVEFINSDASSYGRGIVNYARLQNKIRVNEYYYDLISWKATDFIMDAPYNSDHTDVDAGSGNFFMDRLKRDILSMYNKWFYKSLYMSIVHAKKSGKSTVYLPTSEFMMRIGDASGPYVTKFESKETSRPVGGIYTALDKISGISYEQKTIPEFKFPVVEVDITNFGAGPIERFEKSDKSANVPEESQSAQSIFDKNIARLKKAAATIKEKHNLANYISKGKFNSLKKQYNDNDDSRISIELSATLKNVMPDGHDGILAVPIIKPWAIKEAFDAAASEHEKQVRSGLQDQESSFTEEEKREIYFSEEIPFENPTVSEDEIKGELGASQARGGIQTNMLDQLFESKIDAENKPSKRALRSIVKFAEKLSKRFGIGFVVLNDAEFKATHAKYYEGSKVKEGDIAAFFSPKDKIAYFHADRISKSIVFHELFGHPFLLSLRNNKETFHIYNALAQAAMKNSVIVDKVLEFYEHYNEDEMAKIDEAIIYYMTSKAFIGENQSNILIPVKDYIRKFTEFIKDVFGLNSKIKMIRPDATVEQIASWAIYNTGEMGLVYGDDAVANESFVREALSKFSSKDYDSSMDSLTSLDKLLASAKPEVRSMILNWLEERGFAGKKQTVNGLLSDLNSALFNNETNTAELFSPSGVSLGSFDYSSFGNVMYIGESRLNSKASISEFMASVVRAAEKSGHTKVVFPNNADMDSYGIFTEMNIFANAALSTYTLNGRSVTIVNIETANNTMPSAFASSRRVSSRTTSAHEPSEFIKRAVDGLRAQIISMERKAEVDQESVRKVSMLADAISSSTRVNAAVMFVRHAELEINRISDRLKVLKGMVELDQDVSAEELLDIQRDYLSLFEETMKSISIINRDPHSILNILPDGERAALTEMINIVNAKIEDARADLTVVKKYSYANKLKEEGDRVGSTTIDELLSKDIYMEESDISGLSAILFGMAYSEKEQMRALHKIVVDAKSIVNQELERDGVLAGLTKKWEAYKAKNPLATYERFFEKDGNNRATGYLMSDLKRGQFIKDLKDFKEELRKKYKLDSINDLPVDLDERSKYERELDMWLSENAERMFTPEYYRLRHSLSEGVRHALDVAGSNIRAFSAKFYDKGFIDTTKMTKAEYEKYKSLKKEKQNLSSDFYLDGTPKIGAALSIAREIAAYNKAMSENVKYKVNFEAYRAKEAEIAEKYGWDSLEFLNWWSENNRTVYKQEFWDSLDSDATFGQTEQWVRVYNSRAAILRMFRDIDSMEINAAKMQAKKVDAKIKEWDLWLSKNRQSTGQKSNFDKIANIVPTQEWTEAYEAAKANPNPIAVSDFMEETTYIDGKGRVRLYSQWSKIEPKDKGMIISEPIGIWSDLDEQSNFFNKNFDASQAENGLIPKRSKYDNTKAFEKIKKDELAFDFYNEVLNGYKRANKKYTHLKNPSPYRLAQVTGSFLHKLTHGDSVLKGIRGTLRDKFSYRSYEVGFGDQELHGKYRADGTPIKDVDVRYRTMLDQTDQISRDLLLGLAMYYKAALNFSELSKRKADIEMILDGISETQVKGSKKRSARTEEERTPKGDTRMYKRSLEFVDKNVYGYDRGRPYNIKVPQWLRKGGDDSFAVISMAKPIKDFINYVRKINLAFNVRAIVANFATAGIHLKIEAAAGTYFNSRSLRDAGLELAINMPAIMAKSSTGRGTNKIVSLMRMFDVTRSNEADMRGLHGSKLLNTLNHNFWYGPYTAGDFVVKSQMMIGTLANYKFHNGEFINREAFIAKYFPGERYDGEIVFDSIKENLYDAFVSTKEDGIMPKKEYEEAITPQLIANISTILGMLGRKLDGTLTGSEKSRLHSDAFGAALLLHRGWLVNALQERFHPEIFSYEKQQLISGQYSSDNWAGAWQIMTRFIGNKMGDILSGKKNAWKLHKLGTMKNELTGSQLYNSRRIIGELGTLAMMAIAVSLLYNLIPEDPYKPEKKDAESAEMWAYILTLRVALEMFALYSPGDVYGIVGSPTAAELSFENIRQMFESIGDLSFNDYIETGKYAYKPKWQRALIRATPGAKQLYENLYKADLEATEQFLLGNIPTGPLTLTRSLLEKKSDRQKEIEDAKKRGKEIRIEKGPEIERIKKEHRKEAIKERDRKAAEEKEAKKKKKGNKKPSALPDSL